MRIRLFWWGILGLLCFGNGGKLIGAGGPNASPDRYRLYHRAPHEIQGPERSSRILVICPGLNGSGEAACGEGSPWAEFADRQRLLLVSPTFYCDPGNVHDRRVCYYYPESGSFDWLLNEIDKVADPESGAKYGKSARRWCVEGGREVWCGTGNKRKDVIKWLPGHMAGLMMTGDRVRELGWIQKRCKYDRLILIMPAPCEEWEEISSAIRSYPTTVYVPCVDVDGRGKWWKHRMNGIESAQAIEMEGLGIDCWWLWPEMLI